MRREPGSSRVALPARRHTPRPSAIRRVLVPRVGVLAVVEILRELRELERMERVAHHSELVRLVRADRFLREAGLRAVREPGRMERDRADVDAAARAELAGDVIDHLLGLQIRMVIRNRHCEWIEVELARAERADDEVPSLERLM